MTEKKYKIIFFILAFGYAMELGFFAGFEFYKITNKRAIVKYKEYITPIRPQKQILISC